MGRGETDFTGRTLEAVDLAWLVGVKLTLLVGVKLALLEAVNLAWLLGVTLASLGARRLQWMRFCRRGESGFGGSKLVAVDVAWLVGVDMAFKLVAVDSDSLVGVNWVHWLEWIWARWYRGIGYCWNLQICICWNTVDKSGFDLAYHSRSGFKECSGSRYTSGVGSLCGGDCKSDCVSDSWSGLSIVVDLASLRVGREVLHTAQAGIIKEFNVWRWWWWWWWWYWWQCWW